jgi:seryl-tRNA synthetase
MKIIKVDVLLELIEYKRYVHKLSNNIFVVSDNFTVNCLDEILRTTILENSFELYSSLLVKDKIEDIKRSLLEEIEEFSDRTKYTYNVDVLENDIEEIIKTVPRVIMDDVMFEVHELSIIHMGFHRFPEVKFVNNFHAVLLFEIPV